MLSIDYYLFGYRTVVAEQGNDAKLAGAIIHLGIGARSSKNGGFSVREADASRLRSYVGGRIRCKFGELKGVPGAIKRQRHYILPLIAFILSVALVLFLSSLVWDVRISTDGDIDEEYITERLSMLGVGVGSKISEIDIEKTENELLLICDDLAWVQINRRGTVLEVELREKNGLSALSPDNAPLCSNIVATSDGVIEEITVSGGVAVVRPGDTVKAGDILISGIVSNESGVRFERAEGTVIAHTSDSVSASCLMSEQTESEEAGELVSLSVVILGKTINIFKNYGNLTDDCVIIENAEVYTVADKRLPISVIREYLGYRVGSVVNYDRSALAAIAGERLSEMLATELRGADLVKLRTYGDYTDDGYIITAEFVKAENIGREVSVNLLG